MLSNSDEHTAREELHIRVLLAESVAGVIISPLTTISQPTCDLGRTAANPLLKKIAGSHLDTVEIKLPATLIDRKSCGLHVGKEVEALAVV